jgi:hypothetical protein
MLNEDEYQKSLKNIVIMTDYYLSKLSEENFKIFIGRKMLAEQVRSLSWLLTGSLRTSASALALLEQDKIWDSEVLIRSTMEGSLKFCFILNDPKNFNSRLHEYEDLLPDIYSLKHHELAREAIEELSQLDNLDLRPLENILLSEYTLNSLDKKFSKNQRRKIESKWSFSRLVYYLSDEEGFNQVNLRPFLHDYAMASHITHLDSLGNGIVMEQEYREHSRKRLAHLSRVLKQSNYIISLAFLRQYTGFRFAGKPVNRTQELLDGYSKEIRPLYRYHDAFLKIEFGQEHPPNKK